MKKDIGRKILPQKYSHFGLALWKKIILEEEEQNSSKCMADYSSLCSGPFDYIFACGPKLLPN